MSRSLNSTWPKRRNENPPRFWSMAKEQTALPPSYRARTANELIPVSVWSFPLGVRLP